MQKAIFSRFTSFIVSYSHILCLYFVNTLGNIFCKLLKRSKFRSDILLSEPNR